MRPSRKTRRRGGAKTAGVKKTRSWNEFALGDFHPSKSADGKPRTLKQIAEDNKDRTWARFAYDNAVPIGASLVAAKYLTKHSIDTGVGAYRILKNAKDATKQDTYNPSFLNKNDPGKYQFDVENDPTIYYGLMTADLNSRNPLNAVRAVRRGFLAAIAQGAKNHVKDYYSKKAPKTPKVP